MTIDDKAKFLRKKRENVKQRDQNGGPWSPSPHDLAVYAEYCKMTKSQTEIGKHFKICQQNVSQVVSKVAKWLWRETLDDIKAIKAEHIDHLWHVITEAMEQWERSKEDGHVEVSKERDAGVTLSEGKQAAGLGSYTESSTTVKQQCGDPRYLDIITKSLDDIRKIMGANEPLEVRHSGEVRYAGMTQKQAVVNRIELLQKRLIPSEN